MVNILTAAKSAVRLYAAAISLASNTSLPQPFSESATAMAQFYLANSTSFTLGSMTVFPDQEFARAGIESLLAQYNRSGLGTDIRLEHSKVDVVSTQSAICWVSWKIFPRGWESKRGGGDQDHEQTKVPRPWTFTDVYGFRLVHDLNRTVLGTKLEGGWEWSNADDEYGKLLDKWPAFYVS